MAFDIKRFIKTKYTHRTEEVPVPDLKEFFGPDEPAVFLVRGLDGTEFTNVREAADRQRNITGLLEGLLSTVARDKLESLRETLNLTDSVPTELAKRLEMLSIGSVEPRVDLEFAVKLARTYPIEFYSITTKILELTGLGQVPLDGARPSGDLPECKPPSPSATPTTDSSTNSSPTSSRAAT